MDDARPTQVAILANVAAHLHGATDVPTLLQTALDDLLGGFGLRSGWIFLGDESDGQLHLAAARGLSPRYLEQVMRQGLEPCLCQEVFDTGRRMEAHNTTQCPRMPELLEGLTVPVAHACIPLQLDGRSRGVLNVAARPGQRFDDDALLFLQTVGHQISLGIEAARHRESERRAFQDLRDAQSHIVQGEKMAALGTFASGLAHEVRNPLNSIGFQLARMERKTRGLDPELAAELASLTRIIREEVERLEALVSDFLLFARPVGPDHQPVSLLALAEDVARLLAPEAQAAGVHLEVLPVGEPLPSLSVDGARLKQVVLNLLRNALEAIPGEGRVLVECGLVEGEARLTVHDTGPGLPRDLDIFQLFVTTKPRGTGLGLAIAQQIVLEHGGDLSAQNRPGGGASFTVALPMPTAPGAVRP
ncbi:MAG TPA: ATP-binding protein, partial [Vicinamibacteria bacterium]